MRIHSLPTPRSTSDHTSSPAGQQLTPPNPAEVDTFMSALEPAKEIARRTLKDMLPKARGGSRTEAAAVQEATDLLLGPVTSTQARDGGGEITRDALDVNSTQDTDGRTARNRAARAQLDANAALEAQRLEAMSPEDRARYEAVKARCLDANDPVAALALQKLLFEGRATGPVLEQLASLSDERTPLAEGVDRTALVTDLVQELATPSAIGQGQRGTCAPTTVAIQLAMENPAEYARIVAGLASPSGEVRLAGGAVLRREPGTTGPDAAGRSQVQHLLGPAMMEMANGARDYDDRTNAGAGAWSNDLDVLYEQVMGREMSDLRVTNDATRAQGMRAIDAELAEGQTVPVAISWGTGYHKVLVTGSETVDGVEYIKYTNPWGREERMPRAEFERRLADVSWDPQVRRQVELSRFAMPIAA